MYGERPGERLTEAEQARLGTWLRRRGRNTAELAAMTPLVEARYAARRRGYRFVPITVGIAIVMLGGYGWIEEWITGSTTRTTQHDLVAVTAVYVLFYAVILAMLWYQRRADRRIANALRHRVARSSAVDLPAILGGWFVAATGVTYGGGLLLGGAAASLAVGSDRVISLVFLTAVVLFAVLGLVVLADVARRPAVAEDDRSLVADDTLRRDDAHSVVAPYPALLAVVAGVGGDSGWLMVAYLGYAAAAGLAALASWRSAARARRASAQQGSHL